MRYTKCALGFTQCALCNVIYEGWAICNEIYEMCYMEYAFCNMLDERCHMRFVLYEKCNIPYAIS